MWEKFSDSRFQEIYSFVPLNENQLIIFDISGCFILNTNETQKTEKLNTPNDTKQILISKNKKKLIQFTSYQLNIFDLEERKIIYSYKEDSMGNEIKHVSIINEAIWIIYISGNCKILDFKGIILEKIRNVFPSFHEFKLSLCPKESKLFVFDPLEGFVYYYDIETKKSLEVGLIDNENACLMNDKIIFLENEDKSLVILSILDLENGKMELNLEFKIVHFMLSHDSKYLFMKNFTVTVLNQVNKSFIP
jgi:hypothetical protein